MLNLILVQKNVSTKVKISIHALVSFLIVALSVILPQIVHIFAGAKGGVTYLPMYLPVIIGGCLLGTYWGLGIGILAPITSFIITSLMGNPMPIAARLPYMIFELAVFGLVSGLFSKSILKNKLFVYPAVISSIFLGRLSFLLVTFIFQNISSLKVNVVWNQIQTGYIGIIINLLLVPIIVIGLAHLLTKKDNK